MIVADDPNALRGRDPDDPGRVLENRLDLLVAESAVAIDVYEAAFAEVDQVVLFREQPQRAIARFANPENPIARQPVRCGRVVDREPDAVEPNEPIERRRPDVA